MNLAYRVCVTLDEQPTIEEIDGGRLVYCKPPALRTLQV